MENDFDRRRGLLRRGGDLRLYLPGDPPRPHLRGGDPPLRGGDLLGGPLGGLCAKTAAHVISCPSICPPSMYFIAFSASSWLSYST